MYHLYHISLLCRVQQDVEHEPCSGTCDRDAECFEPCMCMCHAQAEAIAIEEERKKTYAPPGSRAVLHDNEIKWHGDQLHIPNRKRW